MVSPPWRAFRIGQASAGRHSDRRKSHSCDRDVDEVPQDAVDERRLVRARDVEDRARHPAAERHAEQRRRDHHAHAHAGLARREVLADDDRVRRDDAALEQAEQRGDQVQRHEAVERQEQQQRQPCSADPSSSVRRPPMRSQMKPKARRLTMPQASISDSISRAARRPVAQVAAIRDEVNLRHRHRNAARHAGDDEQRLQRGRRQAERAPASSTARGRRRRGVDVRRRPAATGARAAAWSPAEDRDAENVGRQPAVAMKCSTTGAIWCRRDSCRSRDADRRAAPAREPQRHVGEQRREGRRRADADEQAVGDRVLRQRSRPRRARVARREGERAEDHGHDDAVAVGELAHDDAADAEADHRQRVRERCVRARDAELRLHRRQRHHHRPHAHAADGGQHEADHEPVPRIAGVDLALRHQ